MLSLTVRPGTGDRIVVIHGGEKLVIYLNPSLKNRRRLIVGLDAPRSFSIQLERERGPHLTPRRKGAK